MNSLDKNVALQPEPGTDGMAGAPGRDAIAHTLDALYLGRQPRTFENANP